MPTLQRGLVFFTFGWAIASALATVAIIVWFRERYARTVFPASSAKSLLVPAREWLMPVRKTLERFHINEGDTVLELGPGPGYFSIAASRIVGPAGRVLCLDVQPEMTAILGERLRSESVTTAQPLVGDAMHLPLANSSVHKALLIAMLGEIPDRLAAMTELRRVIKRGGVLGFTETLTDPDYAFMSELDDLCRAFGFEKLESHGQLLGYTSTFAAPSE